MNNNEIDQLKEISDTLNSLLNLMRVVSQSSVKELLETELDSKDKRLVYDLTDGTKSVREIASKTGVNISYVSRWGQRWENLGLILPSSKSKIKGRREKVFNLSTYEINN